MKQSKPKGSKKRQPSPCPQADAAPKTMEDLWRELVSATVSELPAKELFALRSQLTKLNPPPAQLARCIFEYFTFPQEFKVSFSLLAVLDCEICRNSVIQQVYDVDLESLVLLPFYSSMVLLIDALIVPLPITPSFLESSRDLERSFECLSKLDIYWHIFSRGFVHQISFESIVHKFLIYFDGIRHGVKLLRSACLALFHLNRNPNPIPDHLPVVCHAAFVFAQVSITGVVLPFQDIASFLANGNDEDVIMLGLETLCAWTSCASLGDHQADVVLGIQLCEALVDHPVLANLSLNAFDKLLALCIARNWAVPLPSLFGGRRGKYLLLRKVVSAWGAMRVLEAHPSLVPDLLASARTVVLEAAGNGICRVLVAFFKSWLSQLQFKVSQAFKTELRWVALELTKGKNDLFVNFYLVRRFLNDLFGEVQSPVEIAANRAIGIFLLKETSAHSDSWLRVNLLLAMERGGNHVHVMETAAPSQVDTIASQNLFQSLTDSCPEIRQAGWALVSTRVKKTAFPSSALLTTVFTALQLMIKGDCDVVRHHLERFVDRVHFVLSRSDVLEEEDEEGKRKAQEFVHQLYELLQAQFYPGVPLRSCSLAMHLLLYCGHRVRLAQGTLDVLFQLMLFSPFDALRQQAYQCLSLHMHRFDSCPPHWRIQVYTQMKSAKTRRECDGVSLAFSLLKEDCFCLDHHFMTLALKEAMRCETVPSAYNVGCVVVDWKHCQILSSGYSREIEGNTHAEEVALTRIEPSVSEERDLDLYTTMEPCSLRLSGKTCCAQRIMESKRVRRVIVGVKEPDLFVQNCQGMVSLKQAGLVVDRISNTRLMDCCLEVSSCQQPVVFQADFVSELVDVMEAEDASVSLKVMALMTLRRRKPSNGLEALLPRVLACVESGLRVLMETEMDKEEDEDDEEDTWLIVREGSATLAELLLQPEVNFGHSTVLECCNWFLQAGLRLKHLGALTWVTLGLQRIAERLLTSNDNFECIVNQWVPELLEKMKKEAVYDKSIRRSEGFAFCIRALVRASEDTNRQDVIRFILEQLVLVQSASYLNVLHVLFEDALSSRSLLPYIPQALTLSVSGFDSLEWKIRSASLSLFGALLKRVVGDQPSKTNANTFHQVFATYPLLIRICAKELEDPHSTYALFPILLFLASMKGTDELFLPLVRNLCLTHPVFQIRSVAARAWSAMERHQANWTLPDSMTASQNALHGQLLFVSHCENKDAVQAHVASVLENEENSFLVREAAVRCLDVISYSPQSLMDWSLISGVADGSQVGRSRFYHTLSERWLHLLIRQSDWAQLLTVARQHERSFREVIHSLKALGVVPPSDFCVEVFSLLAGRGAEEEAEEEALCQLVCWESSLRLPSHVKARVMQASKNHKVQGWRIQALSTTSPKEYAALLSTYSCSEVSLELRLACATSLGSGLKVRYADPHDDELIVWTCALRLLEDEDEQVRETCKVQLGHANVVLGVAANLVWRRVSVLFGHTPEWRHQLVQWLLHTTAKEEDENSAPLEHREVRTWMVHACDELMFLKKHFSELELRNFAKQAREEWRSSATGEAPWDVLYSRLCFVQVFGDPLDAVLRESIVEFSRKNQPLVLLQQRVKLIRDKLWPEYW